MIVIAGDYGQLGNRLVVFANLIACAREHGVRVVNSAFHPFARHFEGTCHDSLCRYPAARASRLLAACGGGFVHAGVTLAAWYVRKFQRRTGRWPPLVRVCDIGWTEPCNVDGPEFLALARRPGVLIARGWLFRARASFSSHADTIRRFFTPIEAHRRSVAALLGRVRAQADVVVGVHIRQGDYRNFEGGRYFYETSQYVTLMQRAARLLAGRRVAFLVCSNGPQSPAAFDGLAVACGTGHVVEDLYALAGCDYLIGPPSTYTQWASFYGGVPLYAVTEPQAPFDLTAFEALCDVS